VYYKCSGGGAGGEGGAYFWYEKKKSQKKKKLAGQAKQNCPTPHSPASSRSVSTTEMVGKK